jgi:hypothetical protein
MVMGISRAEHWHTCPTCNDTWRHPTWSCSSDAHAVCPDCTAKAEKKT